VKRNQEAKRREPNKKKNVQYAMTLYPEQPKPEKMMSIAIIPNVSARQHALSLNPA
jgi:hypothetical protein